MNNKKGFTLVEIIVVVGLLAIFGVAIGISLNRNIKKTEDNKVKEFNKKIIGAANLFASNSEVILTNLYEEKGFTVIRISDLIDAGLVSDNLINPETNEKVTGDEPIKILLDSTGTINIEYPIEKSTDDYLQTKIVHLPVNINKNEICTTIFNSISTTNPYLVYIKGNGAAESNYLNPNGANNKEVNIKCNSDSVKTDVVGTYSIKYDYQTQDGVWKQTTGELIIEDKEPPKCPQEIEGGTVGGNTTWTRGPVKVEIPCYDNYKCEKEVVSKVFENTEQGTITITDTSGNTKDCC